MDGLGSFPFARHYSGNHCYFLFLCLLRCFSSAGLLIICDWSSTSRVAPFGNPRIDSYLRIPGAYRSLSRPSSPLRAKASPVYSFLLSSTHMPFAPYGMLFCSCYDVSCSISACASIKRAQTQQSPIVVCSSFLTSSNMSKNFAKAGQRVSGCRFHCLLPSLWLRLVSKKPRSRTVSYTVCIRAPWRFLSVSQLCQCILPIPALSVFLKLSASVSGISARMWRITESNR